MVSLPVLVDGRAATLHGEEGSPLLGALRAERRGLPVPRGCDDGACGSCRVLVEGELVAACVHRLGAVPPGARIETAHSLAKDAAARRAVTTFERERPTRCQLCVPALVVTAVALARRGGKRRDAVDEVLEDAHCACTGRGSLRRALLA